MRIGIMAAGAIGGYYGARLAAAGHEVIFFARGAHLKALREHGLKLESVLGDLHLPKVTATDDPESIGPVDVVLFAVKLWDTEDAGRQIKPIVGNETRVISLQNGVDSVPRLQTVIGKGRMIGGSAYAGSVIAAPGVIRHTTKTAQIVCGPLDRKPDAALETFAAAAKAAGIDIRISDDMNRELWEKFVFLVGLSGVTAATRQTLGPILADPDTKKLFHDLMRETVAVARAQGVEVPPDLADRQLAYAPNFPPTHKASMLNDLERGNRLEVDWIAGKVAALGRELGVPTPANETVYAVLKLHRMGRRN
jgi:2-dehydropantoate 2-reductase